MKKKIVSTILLMLLLLLTACGGETDTAAQDSAEPEDIESEESSGNAASPDASGTEQSDLITLETAKDGDGNDIAVIIFALTNHDTDDMTYMTNCSETVTQDGQRLEMVPVDCELPEEFTVVNGEEVEYNYSKVLKPGESTDIYLYFRLKDTQTPVTVAIDIPFTEEHFERTFSIS